MSSILTGAVFHCGPKDMASAFVLLAIADNADDFGFAFPATETIATKARCDVRTVYRYLDELEAADWLRRGRKLIGGKANAYFLNLQKLGVTLSPDARRSPVHTALIKRYGDSLSRMVAPKQPSSAARRPEPAPAAPKPVQNPVDSFFSPADSGDRDEISGDNPQPPQVTNAPSQVTKTAVQVTEPVTLTINHQKEPSGVEPSAVYKSPPLPPAGGSELSRADAPSEPPGAGMWEQERFQRLKAALKQELGLPSPGHHHELRAGVNDYDACFRDWWLSGLRYGHDGVCVIDTCSADPWATQAGVAKYAARLQRLARRFYSPHGRFAFEFHVAANLPASIHPAA